MAKTDEEWVEYLKAETGLDFEILRRRDDGSLIGVESDIFAYGCHILTLTFGDEYKTEEAAFLSVPADTKEWFHAHVRKELAPPQLQEVAHA